LLLAAPPPPEAVTVVIFGFDMVVGLPAGDTTPPYGCASPPPDPILIVYAPGDVDVVSDDTK
jgi:hypothetical protein